MTLQEILDKINEIIRVIQFANQSKDEIVKQLEAILITVGQIFVQKELAHEELQRYASQLWISHVRGHLNCPGCQIDIPIDFFVGSKGVAGRPLAAASKDDLIQKLEFPPINIEDLSISPIPDHMPEL